jgi:hypothetical protein
MSRHGPKARMIRRPAGGDPFAEAVPAGDVRCLRCNWPFTPHTPRINRICPACTACNADFSQRQGPGYKTHYRPIIGRRGS